MLQCYQGEVQAT